MGPGLLLFKQAQLCMKMEMDCCKHHESSSSQISELPCCQDEESSPNSPLTFVSSQNLNEIKDHIFFTQFFYISKIDFQASNFSQPILGDSPPGNFATWQGTSNLPLLC